MKLPITGGARPSRRETHTRTDDGRLMTLAGDLEEALELANADVLTPTVVEDIAADLGAKEVHVYAAAAQFTEIQCDESDPIRFELCIGGCQAWGAVELLDHLLSQNARRREDGDPGFGIVAKRCLDKCQSAAIVLVHTPDGTAGLPEATVAKLDEALAQLV